MKTVLLALIVASSLASSAALALNVGESAKLPVMKDATGSTVDFAANKGKWQVIYFYPAVFTGGCTAEAYAYTQLIDGFKAANAVVYGVSSNSADKQLAFIKANDLKMTMLPDTKRILGAALGVQNMGGWYNRDTVLIDPQGKIAQIRRDVNPMQDAKIALEFIRENSIKKNGG